MEKLSALEVRDRGIEPGDATTAAWMSGLVLVGLLAWTGFKGGPVKYLIYTLPFTLTGVYLILNRRQLRLNGRALLACALYASVAFASTVLNSWYDFHALRDIMIVGGYLFAFVLWFRAPSWTADLALATLGAGMLVEAAVEGLGEEVDLFGSNGILESTLAFPIGVVTLYFIFTGRWGRVLIACILLFLSFKRIVFLGVAVAIAFDMFVWRLFKPSIVRWLAAALVVVLSVAALFSAQIFEFVWSSLNLEKTSADSISLGRYNIAVKLWADLASNPVMNWLIGWGPGSADAVVTANTQLINPHNDWLKILYDYGIVGFVAIHAVLFLTLTEHRVGVMLYIYGAIVMMTDNIFIYMFYHPFVMLMISTARR